MRDRENRDLRSCTLKENLFLSIYCYNKETNIIWGKEENKTLKTIFCCTMENGDIFIFIKENMKL